MMHLETEETENIDFPIPSGFTPLAGLSDGLDTFLSNTIRKISDMKPVRVHNNLTKADWQTINDLRKNPNIVIKPADKGGALVIMDRQNYEAECLRQLKDRRHYRRLPMDKTNEVADKVSKYLRTCKTKKEIHSKTVDYLQIQLEVTGMTCR